MAARWSRRRSAGLATRKLSEAFGDGEAAAGEKLDRALARGVERAVARRPETNGPPRDRLDARVAKDLYEAELSLELQRASSRACASGGSRSVSQEQRARARAPS